MTRPVTVAIVTTLALGAAALLLWGLSPKPLDRTVAGPMLAGSETTPVTFVSDPLSVNVAAGRWTSVRVAVGDAGQSRTSHFVVGDGTVTATPLWLTQAAGEAGPSTLQVHVSLSNGARPTQRQQSDLQQLLQVVLLKCGLSANDVAVVGVEATR